MPLNDYRCLSCDHIFEHWDNSFRNVKEIITCPDCGKDAKKQIGLSSFKMNGGYTAANGYAGDSK